MNAQTQIKIDRCKAENAMDAAAAGIASTSMGRAIALVKQAQRQLPESSEMNEVLRLLGLIMASGEDAQANANDLFSALDNYATDAEEQFQAYQAADDADYRDLVRFEGAKQ